MPANQFMSPTLGYFITGTDTDIGKTVIASALVAALVKSGLRVAAMKPVAAGAIWHENAWHNGDADALAKAANVALPAALTTPYLLQAAIAPHIAAELEQRSISLPTILDCYRKIALQAEAIVVEGVGGFRVPLAADFDSADLAQALHLPVILVVGLRLGCLNHALLSADAIAARGLSLAGWVGNLIDPQMPYQAENIAALKARLSAPCLGCVPRLPNAFNDAAPDPAAVVELLDWERLLGWPMAT